ncbi:MAG: alpha/beta fold hydrolase [Pseudoxanthomonas sp.]
MSMQEMDIPVATEDGHRYKLIARIPAQARATLLWLPALGVAAWHYLPLAEALAARGIAVFLHEWRGNGSSSLRASRAVDWGYREILTHDIRRSHEAIVANCEAPDRIIGGHSIGAQFAACYLALHAGAFESLWLVASGSPYWRAFPAPRRYLFPLAFQFVPWIADRRGLLRGRSYGFAGDEARTLMRDWASVGLSNRYAAAGLELDLEAALSQVAVDARGVLMEQDWYAPRRSLQALLDKMPQTRSSISILDRHALGARADHFAWMKRPGAVVDALLAGAGSEQNG